jgi:hypothetical protein
MKIKLFKPAKNIMRTIFLLLPVMGFSRAGFSEVVFETPGGHTICHCDPYSSAQTPILIGFERLEKLDKWYFYKNNIIGKGAGYYFIFNESSDKIQYFTTEKLWRLAIINQNLEPFFITRWLSLKDSPDEFLFVIVLLIILSSPLFLITIIIFWILTYKKVIVWTKRKMKVIGLIFILGLLYIFSNCWLSSF